MEAATRWDSWLARELEAIEIDSSAFGEYITTILDDDSMDEDSKIETITGIIASATDKEVDSAALIARMIKFRNSVLAQIRDKEVAKRRAETEEVHRRMEEENRRLAEEAARRRELASAAPDPLNEELARRVMEMDMDDGGLLDEQGKPVSQFDDDAAADGDDDGGNINKQRTAEIEAQKRIDMKSAAMEKKAKDRESRLAAKLKKEEADKKAGRKPKALRGRGGAAGKW